MLISMPCPKCGAKLHIRPETQRIACRACETEYAVLIQDGKTVLKPVLSGEVRPAGPSLEAVQAARDRLQRDIGELRRLMARDEAETQRSLRPRYALAQWGAVLLVIGLALRFLARLQSPIVLVAAVVGAVILLAAISAIKALTGEARAARKLR
jgi:DNA-directed RNA polymerase subunit RPC12/RpoP